MAGYTVLNTQYNPRSFDEMLKPLALYEDQYRQVESSLSDLQEKSDLSTIINPQTDKISNARYLAYQEELKKVADDLNQNQLTPNTRKSIFDLKAKYAKQIAPILGAYKTYATNIQKKREDLKKDNTLIVDDASNAYTLDDYLTNPNLSYTAISGKDITKRIAAIAKPYSEAIRNVSNWTSTAEGQLVQRVISKGLNPQDINEIMSNPNKFPQLTNTIKSVLESTGVQNMGPEAAKKALGYVAEGLYAGMGKQDIDTRTNENSPYKLWKQQAEKIEFSNRQLKFKQDQQDREDKLNLSRAQIYNAVPTDIEVTETKVAELDEALKNISDWASGKDFKNVVHKTYLEINPNSWAPSDAPVKTPVMHSSYIRDQVDNLAKQYGIKVYKKDGKIFGVEELKQAIQKDKEEAAIQNFNNVINPGYNKPISTWLSNNLTSKIGSGTSTKLLRPIDDGKVDNEEEVDRDNINDYINDNSTYTLDTKKNQLVVSSNKSGETKSAVIDVSVFDNSLASYSTWLKGMKQAKEQRDYTKYKELQHKFLINLAEQSLLISKPK